jgi:hypothetical protein
MKLIGKELDYAIGARLARIILEQFDIKRQKVKQLEEVKQFDQFGIAKQFEDDLKLDEHLLYLDSMMPANGIAHGVSDDDRKRLMVISEYAASLLKQMKVPVESMLRDPSRKDELEIFDKPNAAEIKEKAELEVVVVAGLVFYLDHRKKIVSKISPKS